MRRRALYLEERIAIVREALNVRTLAFERALPTDKEQLAFKQFVRDCMSILAGQLCDNAVRRLKR